MLLCFKKESYINSWAVSKHPLHVKIFHKVWQFRFWFRSNEIFFKTDKFHFCNEESVESYFLIHINQSD